MRTVEAQGVRQLDPLNGPAQVPLPGPDPQVVVIVHQKERVHLHPKPHRHLRQSPEEPAPIVIGEEDPIPPIAAVDHVLPPPRNNNTQRPSVVSHKRLELFLKAKLSVPVDSVGKVARLYLHVFLRHSTSHSPSMLRQALCQSSRCDRIAFPTIDQKPGTGDGFHTHSSRLRVRIRRGQGDRRTTR